MPKNYFTFGELCASDTAKKYGIDNTPTEKVKGCLQLLIGEVLSPVREAHGKPINPRCGYRCPELNAKVGGVGNSQHLTGEAVDLDNTPELQALFLSLVKSGKLVFDQLIIEKPDAKGIGSWLHVSYSATRNRRQVLIFKNGVYLPLKP